MQKLYDDIPPNRSWPHKVPILWDTTAFVHTWTLGHFNYDWHRLTLRATRGHALENKASMHKCVHLLYCKTFTSMERGALARATFHISFLSHDVHQHNHCFSSQRFYGEPFTRLLNCLHLPPNELLGVWVGNNYLCYGTT